MARLTGAALLQYLRDRNGESESALIEGAGYAISRDGKTSLKRTDFYRALSQANGVSIASFESASNGKAPTYELKVGPRGLVPVGRAYTSQCGMEPGSRVRVVIEDSVIVLEPIDDEPSAAPVKPPVAQLADAA